MSNNERGIWLGICFIATAFIIGGIRWLMTGVNDDFGMGVVVGASIGVGLTFLASRRARETP